MSIKGLKINFDVVVLILLLLLLLLDIQLTKTQRYVCKQTLVYQKKNKIVSYLSKNTIKFTVFEIKLSCAHLWVIVASYKNIKELKYLKVFYTLNYESFL